MTKPDDSSLPPNRLKTISKEARRVLKDAEAFGIYPTPVSRIMDCAKVVLDPDDIFDDSLVRQFRRRFKKTLKRALSKVCGIFDAAAKIIYIDRTLMGVKQTFLKLHETAHAFLPWQRKLYAAIEDCEQTIDSQLADEFDREANAFASEVLFQCDVFTKEASDLEFGIRVPLSLSKKYGASIYSTVRRYVRIHHRTCAVLILNMPEIADGYGFICTLRRVEVSLSFDQQFKSLIWPDKFTPDDPIGNVIPLGKRRMSRPQTILLSDSNGDTHEFIAEAFTQTYQVFILICHIDSLRRSSIIIPSVSFH